MGIARPLWRLAALVATLVILAAPALACSPAFRPEQPDSHLFNTPVVFRGRVLAIERSGSGQSGQQRVMFQVLERFKGTLQERVIVLAGGESSFCGYRFREDFEGMVFAHRAADGNLGVGSLSMGFGAASDALRFLTEERQAADEAVAANPGGVGPLLARARMLRRWRDLEEALIAYRELAVLTPELVEPITGIAHVLIAQKRPLDALSLLEEAQARLGPHPDILTAARVARVAMGERGNLARMDFRGADLSDMDLSREDLSGADFSGALLAQVRFEESNLRRARFIGTRFDNVTMSRAALQRAQFVTTRGFPAVDHADLSEVLLDRILFRPSLQFNSVNLDGATIRESRFNSFLFISVRMRRATLATVYMGNGQFLEFDVQGTTLRDVTFDNVVFTSPTESRSVRQSDLSGARLVNVRFQ